MNFNEEIIEQFKTLDVKPSDEIIDKCSVLCKTYNLSVDTFMDQWMAFVLSENVKSNPTIDSLLQLEKKELSKLKKTPVKPSISTPKFDSAKRYNDRALNTYESPKIDPVSSEYIKPNQRDSYCSTPTPKKHSVSIVPKTPYTEKIIKTFGNQQLLKRVEWSGNDNTVKLIINDIHTEEDKYRILNNLRKSDGGNLNKKDNIIKTYMYDNPFGQAEIKATHAKWIALSIIKQNNLDKPVLVDQAIKNTSTVYGRVWMKKLENEKKLYLEGPSEDSSVNTKVPLNLQIVGKNCNLFNGQVIVTVATNKMGRDGLEIQPNIIYTEDKTYVPKPISYSFDSPLQIVVASGPYTLSNSLTYSPLDRFIQYVVDHRPEVAVLIGPFIDEESNIVSTGQIPETFTDFFDNLVKKIMEPLESTNTKVVLVLTYRDVHHQRVYPTSSYFNNNLYHNLYFAPDPCQLSINGIIIGLTSVDVLKHLEMNEIFTTRTNNRDMIPTLVTHILSQKCIYPLVCGGLEIPFDFTLWNKYAMLHEAPHILVLPSKFTSFIHRVKNSLVLNPEYLTNENNTGSFARFQIHPNKANKLLVDNIIGEIVHI